MSIITAKTNSEVSNAAHLWNASLARGTKSMITAPASGAKMATLGAQWLATSSMCPSRLPLHREHENGCENHGAAEEQRAVLLNFSALHAPEDLAGPLGPQT